MSDKILRHPELEPRSGTELDSCPLAPVIDIRRKATDTLKAAPNAAHRVLARPTLVGDLYSVKGRDYVLNEDGLVYDPETEALVFDLKIIDGVFDQLEQLQIREAAIRRQARAMAPWDPDAENSLRHYLTFNGLTEENEEAYDRAA
jgi:hypothetical protein